MYSRMNAHTHAGGDLKCQGGEVSEKKNGNQSFILMFSKLEKAEGKRILPPITQYIHTFFFFFGKFVQISGYKVHTGHK